MTWYAVYETATGKLVSEGTVLADPLPAGLTAKDMGASRPEGVWNGATLVFDPRPAKTRIDRDVFIDRFTPTEFANVVDFAKTNKAAAGFIEWAKLRQEIDIAEQRVIDAVNGMESAGVIGAGRAAEILSGN